ncbi:MAG TPA: hypothetical protein VMU34_20905 [Mycobacterium sp.]|nr:hypothetical protein [Mycobacterium sp.]
MPRWVGNPDPAVTLLGGQPLSLTAGSRGAQRPKKRALLPMSEREIVRRRVCRLRGEIAWAEGDPDAVDARIRSLTTIYDSFTAELTVDEDLAAEFREAARLCRSQAGPLPATSAPHATISVACFGEGAQTAGAPSRYRRSTLTAGSFPPVR